VQNKCKGRKKRENTRKERNTRHLVMPSDVNNPSSNLIQVIRRGE
jgi:hypothetical protein